jgi:zinc protease
MIMKLFIKIVAAFYCLLFLQVTVVAQAEKDAKLPISADVKIGKLANGLTYYIRKNQEPKNRAELRLVVNAGSILETESQLGLAHFAEHMAFNGTKNFKKQELVNFLEKSGVQFGADLNAYTSFDETVYMLPLPTDSADVFRKGFQILEDWAHNVTFENKEIDKERGVVIEEWRLGLGAGERMRAKYFPVILKGSQYANRLPIGTKKKPGDF